MDPLVAALSCIMCGGAMEMVMLRLTLALGFQEQ